MDTAALLLLISSLGANLGWQPAAEGQAGYDILIQVEQQSLDNLVFTTQQRERLKRKLRATLPRDIAPIQAIRFISHEDDLPRRRRMVALKPLLQSDQESPKRLSRQGLKLTQYNGPIAGAGENSRYGNSSAANFDPYAKPSVNGQQAAARNPFSPQDALAEEARQAGQNLTRYSQEQLGQFQNQAARGIDSTVNTARDSVNNTLRDIQAAPRVQAQELFGGQQADSQVASRPLERLAQPLREGVDRLDDRVRTATDNLGDRTRQLFDHLGRPIQRLTGREESQQVNPLRTEDPRVAYPAGDPRYGQSATQQPFQGWSQQPTNQQGAVDPRLLAERDAQGYRAVRGERLDQPIDTREVGRWPNSQTETQYNEQYRRSAEDTYWPRTADQRNPQQDRWPQDRLAANADGGRYPAGDASKQDDWPQYDKTPYNATPYDRRDPTDLANRRNEARFTTTGDSGVDRGSAWDDGPTLADPNFNSGNRAADSWANRTPANVPELRKGMSEDVAAQEQQDDPFSEPRDFTYQPQGEYPSRGVNNRGYDSSGQDPRLTNVNSQATTEKQDIVSAILAWVLFSGSLAGNFYLWWSYLDVRSKYSHIVRESSRSLGRNYSPV